MFPIVGVGASAGGLEAFRQLLESLPLDTGMGFVLVQHLDPDHESQLPQILSRITLLPVHEIVDEARVEPNHVYVIPRDTNLTLSRGVLKTAPRERTRRPHRPIDMFFESLAEDRREGAVGVVLSGTANDGTLGLEAIKAEGGITFAQDDSAKHESMPRSAIAAGCVDLVLSPQEIARELARIAKHPYVVGQALPVADKNEASVEAERSSEIQHEEDSSPLPPGRRNTPDTGVARLRSKSDEGGATQLRGKNAGRDESGYRKILLLLRNHTGVDFSLYKSNTIRRRIARRLVLSKQNTLEAYARFLRGNTKELNAAYSDVLIGVTSFFRNPEMFEVLGRKIWPELLKQRGDQPLRCWVLGCSTGQEAYSIGMSFLEATQNLARMHSLQIFATDLNDSLLEKARHGLYAKSLAEDLSKERLRRFFIEEEGGYRVSKTLREMVVFARQNLISDPPFSRMDVVSCRNLLIYLDPSLQKKAIPTFHYALKPHGFLVLGGSESIGGFSDLFEPLDKKLKIYSKRVAPLPILHLPLRKEQAEVAPGARSRVVPPRIRPLDLNDGIRGGLDAQREADRVTISQFAPPAVLVSEDLQVLQFRGPTSAFLEPPVGKASFDVLKMAREGLMLPLRSALNQVRKENRTVLKEHVRLRRNGKARSVDIEVIPLKNLRETSYLILFKESAKSRADSDSVKTKPAERGRPAGAAESREIVELRRELAEMREYLQSMREQHEAAHEEVQSANEEVQSSNEELQSINEELETSKEELESANEELTTVNEEMSNRNVELNRLNNDLINLQASTKLAILLLGRDLTIRRFSPQAEKEFDLLVSDVGRPISHIRHGLMEVDRAGSTPPEPLGSAVVHETMLDVESLALDVIREVREQEREIVDRSGRWLSLLVRPYMTLEGKVDGAVLVLQDIDLLKRSEQASSRLAAVVESSDDAIISTTLRGMVTSWNHGAERLFGYRASEAIGRHVSLIVPADKKVEEEDEIDVTARLVRGEKIASFQTERQRKDGSRLTISLTASAIRNAAGQIVGTSRVSRDVTDRMRAERAVEALNTELLQNEERLRRFAAELAETANRKNEFLLMLGHELRNPLSALSHGLELLDRGKDDRVRSEELRTMMTRQTLRIVALLDQLLDVARVISGKVTLSREQVDLGEVARQAIETVRQLFDAEGHNLKVKIPEDEKVMVVGDAMRLVQVVENLLTNAAKYTSRGGRIELRVEADPDRARIVVQDNGIGMAPELLPHIFEVFTQAPRALDRSKGGMGLGLPLVQRLVEMHGGGVTARSAGIDQGSEFVVTLPRGLGADAGSDWNELTAPTLANLAPRRILIVDDETDSALSFADLLQIDGHSAHAVDDGPAALAAMETFRPDVVLLDLGLPGMDGFEVARRIRAAASDRVLLIAVTGYQIDSEKLKEAGFQHHLLKPPNHARLAMLLANWETQKTAS